MQASVGCSYLAAAPLGLRSTSRRTTVGAVRVSVNANKNAVRLSSKSAVSNRGELLARARVHRGVTARKHLVVSCCVPPTDPQKH